MATKKIKLNEVAKALHLENKEVISMLNELGGEPKKATSALTEEEMDLIFDRATKAKSVAKSTAAKTRNAAKNTAEKTKSTARKTVDKAQNAVKRAKK